jgi:DNA-binding LacI/PurR family transcriptional regulator
MKNFLVDSPGRGRPNAKLREVVSRIRSSIISGQFPPGSRLQTYDEMGPLLEVSRATLRHAIGILKREGFIESVERSGMHVSPSPPHLRRYGLVFREVGMEGRFRQALAHIAEELTQAGEVEVVVFHGIHPGSDHPDWERFRQEIHSRRLAGILVLSQGEYLRGTGALEDETLPKIAVRDQAEPGFKRIILDNQSFTDQGVDWLLSQGRRRLAAIANGMPDCFLRSCATRGIAVPPERLITIGLDFPSAAQNIAHLLLSLPPDHRPDGLFILNDNFVEYACAGLIAAQARVPEDLSVVVHCCWPWPVPSVIPLVRVGFDAREVVQQALQMINAARRGKPVGDVSISAKFPQKAPVAAS